MKVLVCGSRHFNDDDWLHEVLNKIHDPWNNAFNIKEIIHGCAPGADSLAREYAKAYSIPCREFPALWELHGKSAGFRRNEQMLDEGHPDRVVAFWDGESRGTEHMIYIAKRDGIPVQVVEIPTKDPQ